MSKYIITGGPCTGKTSVIENIAKRGFNIVEEGARQIIEEEKEKKQGILPWTNLEKFQYKVIQRQKLLESRIRNKDAFLDRGLPDSVAYSELDKIKLYNKIYDEIKNANYSKVFILDRLPFYRKDVERRESDNEAEKIHKKIIEVYDKLGFDIITVPVMEIEKRVDYVLENIIGKTKGKNLENKKLYV